MRESVNASFTPYEWLPIAKKIEELGMNKYEFFRYCVLKECGLIVRTKTKNEKSTVGGNNPVSGKDNRGNAETINDLDDPEA